MTRPRPLIVTLALTCAAAPAAPVAPVARAAGTIVTAPDAGPAPHVRAFDPAPPTETASYFAYNPAFTGGVRVAAANFTPDAVPDHVTGPGPGAGPQVSVFNGATHTPLASYFAFAPTFTGGVSVAAADVTHDGHPDVVAATATGAGQVRVFDSLSTTIVRDFEPFGPSFTGGLNVAAGDINGDGYADIITAPAGPGYLPEVRVFSGFDGIILRDFFAYDPRFTGGLTVAAGDVDGDGLADIVTGAGPGGAPHVNVFRSTDLTVLRSFFAYDAGFTGGVRVAAADLDGDGHAELLTAPGPISLPQVNIYSGASGTLLNSFFAYDPTVTSGLFIAATPAPEPTAAMLLALPAVALLRPRRRAAR